MGPDPVQTLLSAADRDEMGALLQVAERLLPFTALPTGPARDLGIGVGFQANHCFELILQRLKEFPGLGWPAISIGLDSRITHTRHMALRAPAQWPRNTWPKGTTTYRARNTIDATVSPSATGRHHHLRGARSSLTEELGTDLSALRAPRRR